MQSRVTEYAHEGMKSFEFSIRYIWQKILLAVLLGKSQATQS